METKMQKNNEKELKDFLLGHHMLYEIETL